NNSNYCVMGSTYSVEEVQKDIDKLKRKVLAFDGKLLSKRYSRLQKKLIQANEKILNVKESSTFSTQRICDQLLEELNECLEILTAKVTNKGDKYEESELNEERELIKHRRKNDAKVIILNIEKEIPYVEREVENIIETKDSGRRHLLKSELRTYFKELALAKTERETALDDRKHNIIQRLVNCYKQLINAEEDINGWIQFENQFDGNFRIRDQVKESNEPIRRLKSLYHESSDSISTVSEQDSLSTSSYISDSDYMHYEVIGSNNQQKLLHHKEGEERPPPLPPRSRKQKNNSEKVKSITQRVRKTGITQSISDNFLPYQRINSIREILINIKGNIDTFDKGYQDPEYTEIESHLLYYLNEIERIDPQGNHSIIASKQQYVDYINALMDYLKETADLMEEEREIEQTPKCDLLVSKINPPIPKKPPIANKPSLIDKKVTLNTSEETNQINPPISAETRILPKVVRPPVVAGDKNLDLNSFTKCQKIRPPIVKDSSDNVSNFKKPWNGNERGDFLNKGNKILPPIVKITETNREELNKNQENLRSKEVPCTTKPSDPESKELGKNDETLSVETENEHDAISDALNLYLLKRLSNYNSANNVYSFEERIDEEDKLEDTESEEDYIKKIESILEDVEELKILDKFFKQTRNFKIYKDMQDILTRVIKAMVHIDQKNLNKEYTLLYEIVSQDIEKFIKDA
ncbi:hypothetical protein ILUMI_19032, partial [Ignelater luminosus]